MHDIFPVTLLLGSVGQIEFNFPNPLFFNTILILRYTRYLLNNTIEVYFMFPYPEHGCRQALRSPCVYILGACYAMGADVLHTTWYDLSGVFNIMPVMI